MTLVLSKARRLTGAAAAAALVSLGLLAADRGHLGATRTASALTVPSGAESVVTLPEVVVIATRIKSG